MRKAVSYLGLSMIGCSTISMLIAMWIGMPEKLLSLLMVFFLGLLLTFSAD